jgi:hypothetical protein
LAKADSPVAKVLEFVMPIHERPFDSLEQLHETEFEQYKLMFDSGTLLAVTAALDYCDNHSLTPLAWAVTEAVKIQCASIRGDTPGKRGRSNGVGDRYRQDAIDYLRWDTVVKIREYRQNLEDNIEALSELPGPTAREHRTYYEKQLCWAKADSFKCVSLLLTRSPAFGAPEAVKKSFLKVEKNMREQKTAMRYYILDPAFLRKVGVCVDPLDRPGKKIVDLFDLKD